MPIMDACKKREYQRRWRASRRRAFFDGKACVKCGARHDLELDHIDPSNKETHAIWSWSKDRRDAELAKCQVLCGRCHKKKSRDFCAKLSDEDIREIRRLHRSGVRYASIGRMFNIHRNTARDIILGLSWKDVV